MVSTFEHQIARLERLKERLDAEDFVLLWLYLNGESSFEHQICRLEGLKGRFDAGDLVLASQWRVDF